MIGRSIGYTRWHDLIPELAQAVRMLEKAPPEFQQLIARAIAGNMQLHEVPKHAEHGLKKLGTEKVIGLLKSQGKRRWYDRDPLIHQAFNCVYLMDDNRRRETAVKILVSLKALEEISKGGQNLRTNSVVVKSVFNKPLPLLLEMTEFIHIPAKTELPRIRFNREEPLLKTDSSEDSRIDSSGEGMRIIRLKRAAT
jgi:hypothetical protein